MSIILLSLLALHTPGISQGRLVVDDADALPAHPFRVILVDNSGLLRGTCPTKPPELDDVEGDGRAYRLEATCPPAKVLDDDGHTIAWHEPGLEALGPNHRLLLRLPGDAAAGEDPSQGATMRKMDDAPLPLRAPKDRGTSPVAIAGWGVGVLAIVLGSRRRQVGAMNLGLAVGGAVGATLLTLAGWPAPPVELLGAVTSAVGGAAVVSLVVAPAPQLRPLAFLSGALFAWWLLR